MAFSPGPRSTREQLIRYAILALIIAAISGLFVQREFFGNTEVEAGETVLGLLDANTVEVGQPVPDFAIRDVNGGIVRLSDFRGKVVVLNFWATWCPPCRAEMPDFQEIFEEREAAGDFAILAVDKLVEDTEDAVRKFVEEFGLTFAVGFDGTDEIFERYGVRGLPSTFFIDRDGILRQKTLGPIFGNLLTDGIALAEAASGS
ncbi:MAG: TlpA disulfide reductase family protein [Dehalococcoidia bacterium]